LFPFILPLYEVSIVYGFAKVIQVVLINEFSGLFFFLFLIELDFFYSLFFFHIVKKIVLEKNHVIKLHKVTKIKGCKKSLFTHTYYTVNNNTNPWCFDFFIFSLCF
jgi:hypothetical protein